MAEFEGCGVVRGDSSGRGPSQGGVGGGLMQGRRSVNERWGIHCTYGEVCVHGQSKTGAARLVVCRR